MIKYWYGCGVVGVCWVLCKLFIRVNEVFYEEVFYYGMEFFCYFVKGCNLGFLIFSLYGEYFFVVLWVFIVVRVVFFVGWYEEFV